MTTESALIPSTDRHLTASEIHSGLRTVKSVLAPDLSDDELRLFAMVASRSGLDPFAKQIYAVKRNGRVTFQTGIDGYRSTAADTHEYGGSDEPEFGPMVALPFPHPEWARTTVYRYRDGERIAQPATAWWDEFYPGPGRSGNDDHMWKKMPRNQLAKCSEALALRKAFPRALADVYVSEEMDQARSAEAAAERAQEIAAQPTAADRIAARRRQAEEVVEAEAVEVTAEPEAVAQEPAASVLCGQTSPYETAEPCVEPAGHKGLHHANSRESWS